MPWIYRVLSFVLLFTHRRLLNELRDRDGLLRVLLEVSNQLLPTSFLFIPFGHVKGCFSLLQSLQLFYVLDHELLVFESLSFTFQTLNASRVSVPHI